MSAAAPMVERTPAHTLRFNLHAGQQRAFWSDKRFILVLAGLQSGKTSMGPLWLWSEMQRKGPGDYLVAAPTFPLMEMKVVPEFKRLFVQQLQAGTYQGSPTRFFTLSDHGEIMLWGKQQDEPTRVIFGFGADPDSLESATAKAAWLDEAGQKKFKRESWIAIQGRLSLHQGRVFITTTPYCYDDQTEIYTDSGWKLFHDLSPDDQVLACTPEGAAHFERPRAIVHCPYQGEMIHFTGGRVDLCVTPNHRMLYRNSTRHYINTAEHFAALSHRSMVIPKTVTVQSEGDTEFVLPGVDGHALTNAPISIPMTDWCAFMGWFLSEGSVSGSRGGVVRNSQYRVVICQREGAKREIIRRDLARLPFSMTETSVGFELNSKQLWSYLSTLGNSETKRIPVELKRAPVDALRMLVDRLIQGDGSYRKNRSGHFSFYSTSRQLAEDFREVCMLLGTSCHVAVRSQSGGRIEGRSIASEKPIYHVTRRARRGGIVQRVERIQYDGIVSCVSVSTGLVLVRRNGEEAICGNTLGWLKSDLFDRWVSADGDHPEIDVINFRSIDNPMFSRDEYERMRSILPGWMFRMRYEGEFDRPAGLIYDCFSEVENVCKRFTIPAEWDRFVGLDFGGVNTCGLFLAKERNDAGEVTGRFFAYREYLTGGKTSAGHVADLRKGEPMLPTAVGGAGSEDQWRSEFGAAGMGVWEPPVREVEVGILRMYGMLKERKLILFDDLAGTLDQLRSYSRVLDEQGEPTEKIEDQHAFHYLDAGRYICAFLHDGLDGSWIA